MVQFVHLDNGRKMCLVTVRGSVRRLVHMRHRWIKSACAFEIMRSPNDNRISLRPSMRKAKAKFLSVAVFLLVILVVVMNRRQNQDHRKEKRHDSLINYTLLSSIQAVQPIAPVLQSSQVIKQSKSVVRQNPLHRNTSHNVPGDRVQTHGQKFAGIDKRPFKVQLSQSDIDGVEKFVFFIGYGRSGHSIVASMMDAHPNIIIANEYYLFDKLDNALSVHTLKLHTKSGLFNKLYRNSYYSLVNGWRKGQKNSKGYDLNLNGTWQGRFDQLKVIGDKTGGATAVMYYNDPMKFKSLLSSLRNTVQVPIRVFHVVRNPYDIIATVALYQASGDATHDKVYASKEKKFDNLEFIEKAVDIVLSRAKAVSEMVGDCELELLEVHLEDLIDRPKDVISGICEFLDVSCSEDYLEACEKKTFRKTSRSREVIEWPQAVRTKIEEAIQTYSFFRRYSFHGN